MTLNWITHTHITSTYFYFYIWLIFKFLKVTAIFWQKTLCIVTRMIYGRRQCWEKENINFKIIGFDYPSARLSSWKTFKIFCVIWEGRWSRSLILHLTLLPEIVLLWIKEFMGWSHDKWLIYGFSKVGLKANRKHPKRSLMTQ